MRRHAAALLAVLFLCGAAQRAVHAADGGHTMGEAVITRLWSKLTPEGRQLVGVARRELEPGGHELARTLLKGLADGNGPVDLKAFDKGAKDRSKGELGKVRRLMRHEVSLLGGYEVQALGDPIDWFRAPRGDQQWPTHLSRHYWLKPLAHAWRANRDAACANEVVAVLLDWTRRTPLGAEGHRWGGAHSAGKGYPATREGMFKQYGDGPWTSLSAHARVETWSYLFAMLWDAPALTNEAAGTLLVSLADDHRRLMINHPRAMNQYMSIAVSLIHLGWWYPYLKDAADAERIGWERIAHYAAAEIYPDGSMAECSPNYAFGCLGRLHRLAREAKARSRDVPKTIDQRIPKALRYFALTADPAGRAPRLAKGRASVRQGLASLNADYQDPAVAFVASAGKKGERPEALSAAFNWAGHVVFRSAWDAQAAWLLFDAGPRGSGHHDIAQLGVQLQAHGQWLLTDPGFFSYSSAGEDGEMYQYLHSTAAHNTGLVDGQNQVALPKGQRRGPNKRPGRYGWTDDGKQARAEGVYTYGYGDGGRIQVRHRRRIVHDRERGEFTIEDRFTGAGEHTVALHWQIPSKARVDAGRSGLTIVNGPARAELAFACEQALTLETFRGRRDPLLGWFSLRYGKLTPAPLARVQTAGSLPITITTRIRTRAQPAKAR